MDGEQKQNTRDFVDHNPKTMMILSQDEFEIAAKHSVILTALRDQILTVKEIHDLFLKENQSDERTHSVTQQTVYRYIEELEKTKLIQVAGFRKTEGVKASERIYGRTARTFITIPNTDVRSIEEETEQQWVANLGRLIGAALGSDPDKLDTHEFTEFFEKYVSKRALSVKNVYDWAQNDERLLSIFSDMTLQEINEAMWYVQLFTPFVDHPELLENLKHLYK